MFTHMSSPRSPALAYRFSACIGGYTMRKIKDGGGRDEGTSLCPSLPRCIWGDPCPSATLHSGPLFLASCSAPCAFSDPCPLSLRHAFCLPSALGRLLPPLPSRCLPPSPVASLPALPFFQVSPTPFSVSPCAKGLSSPPQAVPRRERGRGIQPRSQARPPPGLVLPWDGHVRAPMPPF